MHFCGNGAKNRQQHAVCGFAASRAALLRDTTTLPEALAVCFLCFGWFILASLMTVASGFRGSGDGGFSDAALLGTVMFELPMAAFALTLLHRRGYAVAGLLPRPSWRGTAAGLGLYLCTWAVWALFVQPLGSVPDQPISQTMAQTHVSLPAVLFSAVINGTYEEVFLLGFLMRGLRGYGLSFALGASVLVRMLYHTYQGPLGALDITFFGILFGLYYARTSNLWPVVFGHMLGDIVPFLPYL